MDWLEAVDGYSPSVKGESSYGPLLIPATRDVDGDQVLLKAHPDAGSGKASSVAYREYETLQRVAGPGVLQCVELIHAPGTVVLVFERVAGRLLRDWDRSQSSWLERSLDVAVLLTQAIARVHAARYIHANLHPDSVLISSREVGTTPEVWQLHFEHARPIGQASKDSSAELEAQIGSRNRRGHLPYIAPEQAGRMGRGMDFRADLYSLGCTLYFLFTGRPPFEGDSPLALIHAHMAIEPPRADELEPSLPAMIGDVLEALLRKEPGDRYSSAQVLAQDLERCRAEQTGTRSPRSGPRLRGAKAGGRLEFGGSLRGREAELALLRAEFDRASTSGPRFVWIEGDAGVGKSALVRALAREVCGCGGFFLSVQSDRGSAQRPYAGIAVALQQLAKQIIVAGDEELQGWADRIQRALGELGSVLIELVPEFLVILKERSAVPNLGPRETRARLAYMLERLLACCATSDHPTLLLFDDLEWADAGSRALLGSLIGAQSAMSLLAVATGCHRDAPPSPQSASRPQLDWRSALPQPSSVLTLEPLDEAAVEQVLANTLRCPAADVRELALALRRKTGGNPLLLEQFAHYARDRGWIRLGEVGWEWNLPRIDSAQIPDAALGWVTGKLDRFDPDAHEVLKLAACDVKSLDLESIAALSGRSVESLRDALHQFYEEGLLCITPEGYRFSHAGIREAILARMSAVERRQMHARMGWFLFERTPEPELSSRALEIAEHLGRAAAEFSAEERERAFRVQLAAGNAALALGSPEEAETYLRRARELAAAELSPEIRFELFWHSADAAFQRDDPYAALEHLSVLEGCPSTQMQRAQVMAKTVAVWGMLDSVRATELALVHLRSLGVRWPRVPSSARVFSSLWVTHVLFKIRSRGQLFPTKVGPVEAWIGPLLVLGAAGPSFVSIETRLSCLSSGYALRAFMRHGALLGPCIAIAGFATFRSAFLNSLSGLRDYLEVAEDWLARVDHGPKRARASFVLLAHGRVWTESLWSTVEALPELARMGMKHGDIEFARMAEGHRADYMAFAGGRLCEVREEFLRLAAFSNRPFVREMQRFNARAYALLEGIPDSAAARQRVQLELEIESAAAYDTPEYPWIFQVHWLVVLCVLGESAKAWQLAERLEKRAPREISTAFHRAVYVVFRSVAAAACVLDRSDVTRRQRQALRDGRRRLRAWSRFGPDYGHALELIQGLEAEVAGRKTTALKFYSRAAHSGSSAQHPQYAGIAHERRSSLLAELGDSERALRAARDAVQAYERWGARWKARQLAEKLGIPWP